MSMAEQSETSEFVCGSHVLEIVGYSIIKGLGTGKYIRSSPFHVGGHDWVVQFFPNGKHSYTTGYVSLYVKLLNPSDDKKVSAILSFSLRTREKAYVSDQSSLNTMNSGTLLQNFDAENPIQGVPYFMKKADLSSSKYLVDDSLTFRCILWVCMGTATPVRTAAKRPDEPSSDLATHFGRLLQSGKGADVRFSIGEKTVISAHKCVLAARSPVFRNELFGSESAKASADDIIALEGIDDITFQVLLHFIYTDSLPNSLSGEASGSSDVRRASITSTQQLLAAAARYKVEGLKKICEKKLCEDENITLETVATTLALAEEHQCRELRAACMAYAVKKENYLALPLTEGFEKLKQNYPAVLKELVEKAAA